MSNIFRRQAIGLGAAAWQPPLPRPARAAFQYGAGGVNKMSPKLAAASSCLAFCILALTSLPALAELPITLSTTYADPSQVYVTFQCSFPATFSATYYSNLAKATVPITIRPTTDLSASIALSDIKDGIIHLKFMNSGLIYASLGGPVGPKAPNPRNPDDLAYYIAWQSITEITYTGQAPDSGNMTSINFFGVPCSVAVSIDQNKQIVQQAGFDASETALINELMKLSSTPNEITIKNSDNEVVRVLSPVSFGPARDTQGTLYFTSAAIRTLRTM